jgi:DNA-binding transcriptional MerR regulator
MDDDGRALLTIGQLARRTGLPVRTIRYWSDVGAVPPVGRTRGGYRLYDAGSAARLELVRTLRELGLGLEDVRRVLAKETTVAEMAAVHVAAFDTQIRSLRLARAVLATEEAGAAREHGVAPDGAEGAEILDRILGGASDARRRAELLESLAPLEVVVEGVRGERYWQLLGVMNGWPPYPAQVPTLDHVVAGLRAHGWVIAALRAHG